ncbi:MAG: bifunctional 5,10-methylenetetrahydrofolate dehydrogenase/5,10-methenyltetrahydrofolate cyclohydrolase [Acidobacteriota bacterium]
MTQILDGRRIAEAIRNDLLPAIQQLKQSGIIPGLAAVLVGDNAASEVYVRSKVKTCQALGLHSEHIVLDRSISEEALLERVAALNGDDTIDGILIQLPLPPQINAKRILEAVDPAKDVDGFHPVNVGRLCAGVPALEPCTPAGVIEMLERSKIEIAGRNAVVVGRSDIVGKPMALMLLHRSATVTICHSKTRDLPGACRQADLLIAAIGRPAMITGDYVGSGAVVIDVGMNRISDPEQARAVLGNWPEKQRELADKGFCLVGDVHAPSVQGRASHLTPVPGGVGPLTIAMLMHNTVKAARLRREKQGPGARGQGSGRDRVR